jgi:hypothetical protein
MQWYEDLEKAFDQLTDQEESWIEENYEALEHGLMQLQKEKRFGADEIDEDLVLKFIAHNDKQQIDAKVSRAFLYHWFYLLD